MAHAPCAFTLTLDETGSNLTWLVNAYGGSITECMAYCSCGARALYSQRLIEGRPAPFDSPIKMPGDSYEPRRAGQFVLPGRPH